MKNITLALLLCLAPLAHAKTEKAAQPKTPNTKATMHAYLDALIALKPYLVSETRFSDPANTVFIGTKLQELDRVARSTEHDPMLNQENFKFSRAVLQNHLSETERVFALGSKPYARWMLNSTISMCMGCHTQLPAQSHAFSDFSTLKTFSSEFDQAEFLFAIRDFDGAFKIYDKIVQNYSKKSDENQAQLEKSLERIVAYFARVKRDPKTALVKIKSYLGQKQIPDYLIANLKIWKDQFEAWDKQPVFDPKTATDDQVEAFSKIFLNSNKAFESTNPLLVTYLRVSGVLYEYLHLHPETKITPKILYWLALCDRMTSRDFFYSLSDMYLRECILRFPADPMAPKCYADYESEKILGYTGSSGTNLPPDVVEDLKQLKQVVDSKGKIKLQKR